MNIRLLSGIAAVLVAGSAFAQTTADRPPLYNGTPIDPRGYVPPPPFPGTQDVRGPIRGPSTANLGIAPGLTGDMELDSRSSDPNSNKPGALNRLSDVRKICPGGLIRKDYRCVPPAHLVLQP